MVRLQDVHTAADREAFKRWIAHAPAHKRAYDEVLSAYETSGALRTSDIGRTRDLEAAFPHRFNVLRFGLAGALVVALVLVVVGIRHQFGRTSAVALEAVMLSSGDIPRQVTLADGSTVSMAARSQIEIRLDRRERFGRLQKGKVRLTIANDRRPFRILAGNSVVEADKGAFDAEVLSGEGRVTQRSGSEKQVRTSDGRSAAGSAPSAFDRLEFNAEPLRLAVKKINKIHAGPRLEIDPGLADLRVTGVFQQGGSEAMARSLALAFDLRLVETSPGVLRLAR